MADTRQRRTNGLSANIKPVDVLSQREARLLSIAAQQLDLVPRTRAKPGKKAILEMVVALGCVQLDTISVVARSHETVLWSRLGHYDPALINELYANDGLLTEYWVHAAAILPVESLRFFRRFMEMHRDPHSHQHNRWQPDYDVNQMVLSEIRERGPLPSRAFERPDGPRPAAWSWYGGKPANKALDFLWTSGELTIHRRDGFQRIYELTDRKFPHLRQGDIPSPEEERRHFVQRAVSALGVATARWVADYFRPSGGSHVGLPGASSELKNLYQEGAIVPVQLKETNEIVWLDPTLEPLLVRIRHGATRPTRTTLLSPFDSLVWHRERVMTLFDFDYRFECYVPAPKRLYGYYNIPILHRGALVGRLDPSYDRKRKFLTIRSLHLEPGVNPTPPLVDALAASLRDYTAFLGGGDIFAEQSNLPEFAAMLNAALARSDVPV